MRVCCCPPRSVSPLSFLLAFYSQLPRSFTLTQCVARPSRTPRESCSNCGTDMEGGGEWREPVANQPLKITILVRSQTLLLSSATTAHFRRRERAGRNLCGGGREREKGTRDRDRWGGAAIDVLLTRAPKVLSILGRVWMFITTDSNFQP